MAAITNLVFLIVVTLFHKLADGYDLAGIQRDKVIVCYMYRRAVLRPGVGSFDISNVDPSLCTHIIYAFVQLDENTSEIKMNSNLDLEQNNGNSGFKRFIALKEKYKHLKLSVSMTTQDPKLYYKMAADRYKRYIFMRHVMNFLGWYNFDGLDLYVDYALETSKRKKEDRENFVTLIKELSEQFKPKGYLLTAVLRADTDFMSALYDLADLNSYLDFLHLKTYSYHVNFDGVVGANTPLFGQNENDTYNVNGTITHLLQQGLTPSKIVLGLPMYGTTYTLNDPDETNIVFGETTTTTGFGGSFTGGDGYVSYNEICLEFANKPAKWVHSWHDRTYTPYIRDRDRLISYENPRSLVRKVKYAIDHGLGGVSVWDLSLDNFGGSCDEEPDTYKDYIERFNKMADLPLLKDAIISLNEGDSKTEYYVIANKKVRLRLPKTKFANYTLLRTVNDAINLVTEEKKVMDKMEDIIRDTSEIVRNIRMNGIKMDCIRTFTEICSYGM